MNNKFVNVSTGEVVEAALVAPDGSRFWTASGLNLDGTPNGRTRSGRGKNVGITVRRLQYGADEPTPLFAYNGNYSVIDTGTEVLANEIRARIERLESEAHEARISLRELYVALTTANNVIK